MRILLVMAKSNSFNLGEKMNLLSHVTKKH